MRSASRFTKLSDVDLTRELTRLARHERRSTVELLTCLEEFDRRRLYLGLGFPSLFNYCQKRLHLTDGAAFTRIAVARALRRHPEISDMIADGRLSLTTASLLIPHLKPESAMRLLSDAAHQSKREVDMIVARVRPQPPVPSVLRKLPEPKPVNAAQTSATSDEAPVSLAELVSEPPVAPPASRRPVVAPLSESHFKLQVTISAAARERLRAIQDLMRHRLPSGDPAAIVEHALEVLHAELLKKKAAEVARPRASRGDQEVKGRHMPAAVKRAVFRRDRGACAFVSDDGTKCGSTSGVEFHHVRPYAVGGEATAENIEMRCRAHNGFEWTRHLDEESAALDAR
jgi:hypothetical protein